MTNRELYKAVIAHINGEALPYGLTEAELREGFEGLLAKLDATNEKRKAASALKAAEKQAEKDPLREQLFAVMGGEDVPMTASMLIEAAGLAETVKPASVPSLMRPLVEAGRVVKVDVKIPGKGTQRGYVHA